jgi:hypothetical protein
MGHRGGELKVSEMHFRRTEPHNTCSCGFMFVMHFLFIASYILDPSHVESTLNAQIVISGKCTSNLPRERSEVGRSC